jgi:hypothetical protein
MNRVVKILMDRDGMTEQEAEAEVERTREDLNEGFFDAMQVNLGLEDDYIFDVLF